METIKIVSLSLVISIISIVLIRYFRVGFPRHYFSLGQILIDDNDNSKVSNTAILVRFSPPLLTGLVVGLLRLQHGLEIALMSSFFGSFLVVWPVMLVPKELLTLQAYRRKKALYLIHWLYVITSVALGTTGWLLGTQGSGLPTFLSRITYWTLFGQNVFATVVVNVIVLTVIGLLSRLFTILWKEWKRRVGLARRSDKEC